jgi:hypothetical protein
MLYNLKALAPKHDNKPLHGNIAHFLQNYL